MSLLLFNCTVKAAVSPRLSVNLLSRSWASLHSINHSLCTVDLPLTICFLGKVESTILSFMTMDSETDELGFEIILGWQWDSSCREVKGEPSLVDFFLSFNTFIYIVPCPLPTGDDGHHPRVLSWFYDPWFYKCIFIFVCQYLSWASM